MRRMHAMPFGAQVLEGDRVRFRLWAPGAHEVELRLEGQDSETVLSMGPHAAGWFELVTDQTSAGSLYRYRIDGDLMVPDPASRYNPRDVHGPSEVIDPKAFNWQDEDWQGRRWEETVLYELHVGAFSEAGTFAGIIERLDHLVNLGVTAIELMPVADFPGQRNWGYDGVLLFAPDSTYGRPEDLKALVQAAHRRGLMVFMDVVYNHFGPQGNYLHAYAPAFFTEHHHTPWGAAINFDDAHSRTVRDFMIHNALYWLEEFHLDGLRLDAVETIVDDSSPDILQELADTVHRETGHGRHIHLVLENDDSAARYLQRSDNGIPRYYTAQWNDDIHHALHVLLTDETEAYYADYADKPAWYLGRCLSDGFGYQGEPSHYRGGRRRGEPSRHLPPTAFVSFLQNHDQVGNRGFSERIGTLADSEAVRAVTAILLLAPSPPLLFMGEEFGSRQPFAFFCDFAGELAGAVTEGRRRGFARFKHFADPAARNAIADPNDPGVFQRAKLDWDNLFDREHQAWADHYRHLLELRHREIIPRLRGMPGRSARFRQLGQSGLWVRWRLGDGGVLILLANLSHAPLTVANTAAPPARPLYAMPDGLALGLVSHRIPPWSVGWFLASREQDITYPPNEWLAESP